jgi:AcrR family transcriptional regulator
MLVSQKEPVPTMAETAAAEAPGGVPERLIQATIRLFAEQGPSAVKARTVAAAAGLSTIVVYRHFGGIPELLRAVIAHGFKALDREFAEAPVTDDPVGDLATLALTCRGVARDNPHLYDLMFGLSARATYRPLAESDIRSSGGSRAFQDAYDHVSKACQRLVSSGRVRRQDPIPVAAQLWSMVHGFITLELAEAFTNCDDPVTQVLLPMGVNLAVGLGDTRELAEASHEVAIRRYNTGIAHHA